MIKGLNKFKEFFRDYTGSYVIVGGVATFLILNELDPVKPKATKDIDMVIFAKEDNEFIERLKLFLNHGEYDAEVSKGGEKRFYRFVNPKQIDYPEMIEVFVRKDSKVDLDPNQVAIPIDSDKNIDSLSALLLDEEYFELVKKNVIDKDGLQIINHLALIPLKAKAYIDIKARGENSLHWKKHRSDILNTLININSREVYNLSANIKIDLNNFISQIENELTPDVIKGATGIKGISKDTILSELKNIFELNN